MGSTQHSGEWVERQGKEGWARGKEQCEWRMSMCCCTRVFPQVGESDRAIPTKMPKHLFSGKKPGHSTRNRR